MMEAAKPTTITLCTQEARCIAAPGFQARGWSGVAKRYCLAHPMESETPTLGAGVEAILEVFDFLIKYIIARLR